MQIISSSSFFFLSMQLDSAFLALLGNWNLLSATQKGQSGTGVGSNEQLSYSVTYRAAVVWGGLPETMEGFERSGVL